MNIHQLPGYHIANNDMPQRYAASLRASLATKEALFAHIDRWKAVWELWPKKSRSLRKVIKHQISDWAFRRLKTKGIDPTFVPGKKDGVICDLLVPPVLLQAMFVAKQFGVPFCTALHQAFCAVADHEHCF